MSTSKAGGVLLFELLSREFGVVGRTRRKGVLESGTEAYSCGPMKMRILLVLVIATSTTAPTDGRTLHPGCPKQ